MFFSLPFCIYKKRIYHLPDTITELTHHSCSTWRKIEPSRILLLPCKKKSYINLNKNYIISLYRFRYPVLQDHSYALSNPPETHHPLQYLLMLLSYLICCSNSEENIPLEAETKKPEQPATVDFATSHQTLPNIVHQDPKIDKLRNNIQTTIGNSP